MKRNSSSKKLSTPLNKALKFLSYRQRSIKEIRDYLIKKEYSQKEIDGTIEKLIELKFLDDREFTNTFIRSRQAKGRSKKVIDFELKLKGIDSKVAEESLEEAPEDLKIATQFIEKRWHQYERLDPETQKKRIINRLKLRGYSWNIISEVLKRFENKL